MLNNKVLLNIIGRRGVLLEEQAKFVPLDQIPGELIPEQLCRYYDPYRYYYVAEADGTVTECEFSPSEEVPAIVADPELRHPGRDQVWFLAFTAALVESQLSALEICSFFELNFQQFDKLSKLATDCIVEKACFHE